MKTKILTSLFIIVISILFFIPNISPHNKYLEISRDYPLLPKEKDFLDTILHIKYDTYGKHIIIPIDELPITKKAKLLEFFKGANISYKDEQFNPLSFLGTKSLNLGLDLVGGVQIILEVNKEILLQKTLGGILDNLLDKKIVAHVQDNKIISSSKIDNPEQYHLSLVKNEGSKYYYSINEDYKKKLIGSALSQNISSIRKKVDALGVSEISVKRMGLDKIMVEIPGVSDLSKAKSIIGNNASLSLRLEYLPIRDGKYARHKIYKDKNGKEYDLLEKEIVGGRDVVSAVTSSDRFGNPAVSVQLSSSGANKMRKVTSKNINKSMAIIFVDNEENLVNGKKILQPKSLVVSFATIRGVLGSNFQITGLSSFDESRYLSTKIREGGLVAPVSIVSESVIGPTLGEENIKRGVYSIILGASLVFIFLLFYYRVWGIIASITLLVNLLLVTFLMGAIGTTLTLPGLVALVLTVGMAVDSNVLIFQRIKEEMKENNFSNSFKIGYSKAIGTILDSNITTILIAFILYSIGNGPVQGFAISLIFGILVSLFTSIYFTKMLMEIFYYKKLNGGTK